MSVRIAINGFGRTGRVALCAAHETTREDFEIVAINDLGSVATNAHLTTASTGVSPSDYDGRQLDRYRPRQDGRQPGT